MTHVRVNVRLEKKLQYWPIQFEHNNDLIGWASTDVRGTPEHRCLGNQVCCELKNAVWESGMVRCAQWRVSLVICRSGSSSSCFVLTSAVLRSSHRNFACMILRNDGIVSDNNLSQVGAHLLILAVTKSVYPFCRSTRNGSDDMVRFDSVVTLTVEIPTR